MRFLLTCGIFICLVQRSLGMVITSTKLVPCEVLPNGMIALIDQNDDQKGRYSRSTDSVNKTLCSIPIYSPVLKMAHQSLDEIFSEVNKNEQGEGKLVNPVAAKTFCDGIMVDLDMCLTRPQELEMESDLRPGGRLLIRKKRKIVNDVTARWPHNTIPYEINENDFTIPELRNIIDALTEYEVHTCIIFKPATPLDKNKLVIMGGHGCYSNIGMIGGTQRLVLDKGNCRQKRVIIHELGHAIGLVHEHQRWDRDNYITILRENVRPTVMDQFKKFTRRIIDVDTVPYDYLSIMHYGKNFFSIDGQSTTIRTNNPNYQDLIGKTEELSFIDIKAVNSMYRCNARCPGYKRVICPGDGYQDKYCACRCSDGKPCSSTPGLGGEINAQSLRDFFHQNQPQSNLMLGPSYDLNHPNVNSLARDTMLSEPIVTGLEQTQTIGYGTHVLDGALPYAQTAPGQQRQHVLSEQQLLVQHNIAPKLQTLSQELVLPQQPSAVQQQQGVTQRDLFSQQHFVQQHVFSQQPTVAPLQTISQLPTVGQEQMLPQQPTIPEQQTVPQRAVIVTKEMLVKPTVSQQQTLSQQLMTPKQKPLPPKLTTDKQQSVTPKSVIFQQQKLPGHPTIAPQQPLVKQPLLFQQQESVQSAIPQNLSSKSTHGQSLAQQPSIVQQPATVQPVTILQEGPSQRPTVLQEEIRTEQQDLHTQQNTLAKESPVVQQKVQLGKLSVPEIVSGIQPADQRQLLRPQLNYVIDNPLVQQVGSSGLSQKLQQIQELQQKQLQQSLESQVKLAARQNQGLLQDMPVSQQGTKLILKPQAGQIQSQSTNINARQRALLNNAKIQRSTEKRNHILPPRQTQMSVQRRLQRQRTQNSGQRLQGNRGLFERGQTLQRNNYRAQMPAFRSRAYRNNLRSNFRNRYPNRYQNLLRRNVPSYTRRQRQRTTFRRPQIRRNNQQQSFLRRQGTPNQRRERVSIDNFVRQQLRNLRPVFRNRNRVRRRNSEPTAQNTYSIPGKRSVDVPSLSFADTDARSSILSISRHPNDNSKKKEQLPVQIHPSGNAAHDAEAIALNAIKTSARR